MKQYAMKDLGYQRTPTDAWLRVEMPDGWWEVPVQIIADDRDANYSEDQEDTIEFILADELNSDEITDWAANNMNWSDVAEYAKLILPLAAAIDYQDGWVNGKKKVVGLRNRR